MDFSSQTHFLFSSGGRHHFQGYGEWCIDLDKQGHCHIQHFVAYETKFDKEYTLALKGLMDLWKLIDDSKIDQIQVMLRPGIPDEVTLTFSLKDEPQLIQKEIWHNDLGKFPTLKQLVTEIKSMIEKYTKERVII